MDPAAEKALLDRFRAGNHDALTFLLAALRPRLVAALAARLPTTWRHEAEDLVASAVAKALAKATDFDGDTVASLERWLAAFVDNARRDRLKYHLRARRDDRRTVREPDADGSGPGLLESAARHHETPSRAAIRQERDATLHRALRDTLSPREYEAVQLRYFVMLSVEETARRMGVSAGRVKNLCTDALNKLRATLPGLSQLGTST